MGKIRYQIAAAAFVALAGCAAQGPSPGTPVSGAASAFEPSPVQQQILNQQALILSATRRHIATNCSYVGRTPTCTGQ